MSKEQPQLDIISAPESNRVPAALSKHSGKLWTIIEALGSGAQGAMDQAISAAASGGNIKIAIALGATGGFGKFIGLRAYEWATKIRRIEPLLPQIEAAADRLKGTGAEEADVNDYARAAAGAYSSAFDHTADPLKQKVIAAALVNSFLPEIYHSGSTLTLFGLLEELDYGELYLLARVSENGHLQARPGFDEFNKGTMNRYHLDRLLQRSLLVYPDNLGFGVSARDIQTRMRVTELGVKLQKLMAQVAHGEVLFAT